jgi:GNAT superfamily N-acetyltransferase
VRKSPGFWFGETVGYKRVDRTNVRARAQYYTMSYENGEFCERMARVREDLYSVFILYDQFEIDSLPEAVGYVITAVEGVYDIPYFADIFVREKFRRQKFGTRLRDFGINEITAHSQCLQVAIKFSSQGGRALFEGLYKPSIMLVEKSDN